MLIVTDDKKVFDLINKLDVERDSKEISNIDTVMVFMFPNRHGEISSEFEYAIERLEEMYKRVIYIDGNRRIPKTYAIYIAYYVFISGPFYLHSDNKKVKLIVLSTIKREGKKILKL